VTTATTIDERPPYRTAGAVALAVLALYVATLAPTAQFWDTPEYLTAAFVLGIPHPPGNPSPGPRATPRASTSSPR